MNCCKDCKWWVKDDGRWTHVGQVAVPWGSCHRYPPSIIPVDDGEQLDNDHPNTLGNDWCGEFGA